MSWNDQNWSDWSDVHNFAAGTHIVGPTHFTAPSSTFTTPTPSPEPESQPTSIPTLFSSTSEIAARVWDIPELRTHICSFLVKPKHLHKILLLSKGSFDAAVPSLYKSFFLRDAWLDRDVSPERQKIYLRSVRWLSCHGTHIPRKPFDLRPIPHLIEKFPNVINIFRYGGRPSIGIRARPGNALGLPPTIDMVHHFVSMEPGLPTQPYNDNKAEFIPDGWKVIEWYSMHFESIDEIEDGDDGSPTTMGTIFWNGREPNPAVTVRLNDVGMYIGASLNSCTAFVAQTPELVVEAKVFSATVSSWNIEDLDTIAHLFPALGSLNIMFEDDEDSGSPFDSQSILIPDIIDVLQYDWVIKFPHLRELFICAKPTPFDKPEQPLATWSTPLEKLNVWFYLPCDEAKPAKTKRKKTRRDRWGERDNCGIPDNDRLANLSDVASLMCDIGGSGCAYEITASWTHWHEDEQFTERSMKYRNDGQDALIEVLEQREWPVYIGEL